MNTDRSKINEHKSGLIEKIRHRIKTRRAKQITDLYWSKAPPPPQNTSIPKTFGYIHYKAFSYLTQGPEKYRRDDFFHLPPEDLPRDRLETIAHGCQQILQWRGLTHETALEGIEIQGFYDLLRLFHFDLKQQSALVDKDPNTILDMMEMKHVITSEEITLYNRVKVQ